MQTMLQQNLLALSTPTPKHRPHMQSEGGYHQYPHPAVQYRKPIQFEDSGIGSEESMALEAANLMEQISIEVGPPKPLPNARPVIIKPKLIKRTSVLPAHNRPAKPKPKRLTPSDVLFTAGKINVFLYSWESTGPSLPSHTDNGSVQLPISAEIAVESTIDTKGSIHPFLHLEVSQPSAIISVERHQQKIELSIYDVSLDGASVRNSGVGKCA